MKRLSSLILPVLLLIASCGKPYRAIMGNVPRINSYKLFKSKTVEPAKTPYSFKEVTNTKALGDKIKVTSKPQKPQSVTLTEYLEKSPTRAFIIIRNDSIIYENYFDRFEQKSTVTSFSVAKSFVSALLGIAIDSGLVKSVKQPITDFLTELDKDKFGSVTIEHLLRHTSGIKFRGAGHQYYCSNILSQYNHKIKFRSQPGEKFLYDNANTQTLGIILERVFKKDLAQVLQEKIWQPCGMEYPITWSVDSKHCNQIKAFCCLNGVARDFAKFGSLYLHNGNWNGKQIVSKEWVQKSVTPDDSLGGIRTEKYHWWLVPDSQGAYYAGGLYGQYIMVYPAKNLVLVRFAERNFQPNAELLDFFMQVIEQL